MKQEKRNPAGRRAARRASWRLVALLALPVLAVLVPLAVAGCRTSRGIAPDERPGSATSVWWPWSQTELLNDIEPAVAETPRWDEFIAAAEAHRVLIHDFQYFEGHPRAVDPTWEQSSPPDVRPAAGFVEYPQAGRWHYVDYHFGPAPRVRCFVRLPADARIGAARPDAWQWPAGTELVQFLYAEAESRAASAVPVEWRRMLNAGPERGQMRPDGSRSDWTFEAAIRDPSSGRWTRVREDGQDATWTTVRVGSLRVSWPVVRPHTCAACHAMAGDSPFDGPRGAAGVYSLGDLRELAWAGSPAAVVALIEPRPADADLREAEAVAPPPDFTQRFNRYVEALAAERRQPLVLARTQQLSVDHSPFLPGSADAIRRGADVYLSQCAGCHGRDADGRGRFALRHPAPPGLLRVRRATLLKIMRQGDGSMPAWNGVIPGDDQWRIIEYLQAAGAR